MIQKELDPFDSALDQDKGPRIASIGGSIRLSAEGNGTHDDLDDSEVPGFDKHLTPLLRACTDEELDPIVHYIMSACTHGLSSSIVYKPNHPRHHRYADEVVREIRTFGGHTLKDNLFGQGVHYGKIAWDVCERLGADPKEGDSVEDLELKAIVKMFGDIVDNLDPAVRAEFEESLRQAGLKGIRIEGKKWMATLIAQVGIKQGGFAVYRIAAMVANRIAKMLLGKGLSFGANAALMKAIGIFAGPIGMGWTLLSTVWDVAGPAYRVTIPCVLHVGFLRLHHAHGARNEHVPE